MFGKGGPYLTGCFEDDKEEECRKHKRNGET